MANAWCPSCQRMQEVIDESIESAFTSPTEETDYAVRTFACGHDTAHERRVRKLPW